MQQLLAKEAAARKKMDFREILALFHDRPSRMDPVARERAWENLWQTTLAEAQEEHRQQRKNGGKSQQDDMPMRGGSIKHSGGPEPPKRPRQVRSPHCVSLIVITIYPLMFLLVYYRIMQQGSGTDLEPNKLSRLNARAPNRPKTGSKLMQKLGARGT